MNRNSFPLLHKKELCGRKRCKMHEKEKTTYKTYSGNTKSNTPKRTAIVTNAANRIEKVTTQ